jgi:predicted dehydrogenase
MEEMLRDPAIDMVYVASPNCFHYAQAKAALLAGKHVLCEKPFAPTVEEAQELVNIAKEKGLFLFEAITTAHHPHYSQVKQWLPQLGNLKTVICTFCQYSSRYPALLAGKASPVLDHAFAGGALMDINLYNIHFVVGLFGRPQAVQYYPNRHETGVDTSGLLILEYPDFVCQCVGAKDSAAANGVQIIGEDGYMVVGPSASNCQKLTVQPRGGTAEEFALEENPWYYEVQDLGRIIERGDMAFCHAALDITRDVVWVLEQARRFAGFDF